MTYEEAMELDPKLATPEQRKEGLDAMFEYMRLCAGADEGANAS